MNALFVEPGIASRNRSEQRVEAALVGFSVGRGKAEPLFEFRPGPHPDPRAGQRLRRPSGPGLRREQARSTTRACSPSMLSQLHASTVRQRAPGGMSVARITEIRAMRRRAMGKVPIPASVARGRAIGQVNM